MRLSAAKHLHQRVLATLSISLLLGACAGEPTIQTGEDAETIMGGSLNKVDNARADLAYVDPIADFGRYTRAMIAPLDVDNIEIHESRTSTSMINRYNQEWELNDSDKESLRSAFMEIMEEEITKGEAFELTDEDGDDVIRIEAMITAIAPSAPKDDAMSRGTGRSRVFTQGAGGMSISITFADGDSGEVLAIVKDTRTTQNSNWGVNNRVTNMSDVRRNFRTWATRIHDGLLALRARAENM